jgi:hypothetical protein
MQEIKIVLGMTSTETTIKIYASSKPTCATATDFSLQRNRFNPTVIHVGFMMNRLALGHVFLWILQFYSDSFHSIKATYSAISVAGLQYQQTKAHPISKIIIITLLVPKCKHLTTQFQISFISFTFKMLYKLFKNAQVIYSAALVMGCDII